MEAPPPFALLTEAADAMRAHWIAGGLEAAGIPTHVDADMLADEFAMSQKLLGLQRVRVLVPADRLEEARVVLGDLEHAAPPSGSEAEEQDEDEVDGEPAPAPRKGPDVRALAIVLLGAAVLVLALLLAMGRRGEEGDEKDPLYTWKQTETTETAYWKDSGKPAYSYADEDGDRVYEITHWYDREGRLVTTTQDRNGNGIPELTWTYVPGKDWIYMSYDEDEDGLVEMRVYREANGAFERWLDADADGRFEAREFVRVVDGQVVQREEDRGAGTGWQRVR